MFGAHITSHHIVFKIKKLSTVRELWMVEDQVEAAISMASSVSPPKVRMEVHVRNREKLLSSLRQHLSAESGTRPLHGFVLLQGGDEQTRYDTDHLELFRYPISALRC